MRIHLVSVIGKVLLYSPVLVASQLALWFGVVPAPDIYGALMWMSVAAVAPMLVATIIYKGIEPNLPRFWAWLNWIHIEFVVPKITFVGGKGKRRRAS